MTIRFFIPKARLARKAAKVRKLAACGDARQQLVLLLLLLLLLLHLVCQ